MIFNKDDPRFFDFINLVVTFFGVGNMKICPGTWGSIAALPLWIFLNFIFTIFGIFHSPFLTVVFWSLILIGLFYFGAWASDIYVGQNKIPDASEIVIDEVVGQLLAFCITTAVFVCYIAFFDLSLMSRLNVVWYIIWVLMLLLVVPIVFFRVFDIAKPWFIGKIDKDRKDGIGIMLDDVLAGVCAGINSSILMILFLNAW